MKKTRKSPFLLASLFLSAALLGCQTVSTEPQNVETLRVGVRDDIVNFGYLNPNTNKYYGLEIDIAQELASRLGYGNVDFTTVTPDNRKEILLNGQVDCLIAAYSIADSRLKNFDFSAPYYTDQTVIMVEKSTRFTKIEDLKEKNIGILSGTNAGPLLATRLNELGIISDVVVSNTDTETIYEGAYVTKAPSYEELSNLLEEGKVDAVCMDACIAKTYMNDDRQFIDTSIAEQQYGVATQKGSDLSVPIAEAIQSMLDDGTIDGFIDKWN